jgi:hypothetical protein
MAGSRRVTPGRGAGRAPGEENGRGGGVAASGRWQVGHGIVEWHRRRDFTAASPARTAASVVQIWSIAADSCANLQAPWRTHKWLILLGFRCPVVPGRLPEGPLERTCKPWVLGSTECRPNGIPD